MVSSRSSGVVADEIGIAFPQPVDDCLERAALHQLHRVIEAVLRIPSQFMDRDDVGMLQPGQNGGLADKPRPRVFRRGR